MKKRILIIDDSESIRELLGNALENAGYDVIKAIDGKDGVSKLEEPNIFLIISDLNMPQMDGIEVIKHLRKHPVYQFTPIIVLTTESQEAKRMEAKEAGATGWMTKPFNTDKLITVIKKIIR
ncbi:MAG: hypothetical protein A3F72_14470 [Bacteroidetes bacterium RIFCSPLOWO2_12_FULL_35_15]|nr:MAG: hypothetical protein A3F72_14470 [Bacteroidetes bacterium RIFCSPLOWO2_12_FULL_35_15]